MTSGIPKHGEEEGHVDDGARPVPDRDVSLTPVALNLYYHAM